MQKSEIKVGGMYKALSYRYGVLRVDAIDSIRRGGYGNMGTRYTCTHMDTGRTIVAWNASKFRCAVADGEATA